MTCLLIPVCLLYDMSPLHNALQNQCIPQSLWLYDMSAIVVVVESAHEAQMYQIQTLLEKLPPVNRETLKRMIGHLRR